MRFWAIINFLMIVILLLWPSYCWRYWNQRTVSRGALPNVRVSMGMPNWGGGKWTSKNEPLLMPLIRIIASLALHWKSSNFVVVDDEVCVIQTVLLACINLLRTLVTIIHKNVQKWWCWYEKKILIGFFNKFEVNCFLAPLSCSFFLAPRKGIRKKSY